MVIPEQYHVPPGTVIHAWQRTAETDPAIIAALDTLDDAAPETARAIRCAVCDYAITDAAAKMSVNSLHTHRFINPAGLEFEIGCFSEANGAAISGPPSAHWSWFPPYLWRVAVCRDCQNHLGWRFELDGEVFFGLILNRLVEEP